MKVLLLDDDMTSSMLANDSCDRASAPPSKPLASSDALPQIEQHLAPLQTVIDTSEDWIFAKDTQFRYILVNQSYASVLNRTPESMLGKTDPVLGCSDADDFGDPEKGTRGSRTDDIDVLSGKSIHNPYDVVTLGDGHQIIFDTHKKPLRSTDGSIVGVVSTSKNVTARHRVEMQLSESRNLLQQVLDSFPAQVFWKDCNSVYLGCNQRMAQVAGVETPTDIIGKTDFDLPWAQSGAEYYRTWDRRIMETGIAEMGVEEPQLQADDQQGWLETSKIPLRNHTGDIIGILGTRQNITERKQAQLELRTSQQQLNLIVEQSPLAIIEWDTQGRVKQWNRAAEQTFGYSKAEALGQHMRLIIAPEDHEHVDQVVAALLTQTGGHRAIGRNTTQSGHAIVCEWYNAPLVNEDGQVVGIASMAFDVTERQRAEAKIVEQNRLSDFRAEVDAALIRNSELSAMLQSCTEAVVQYLDAAFARIWTLNQDGTLLELQASAGLYTHTDGGHAQVPVGQFKIGLIAEERHPHITNAVQQDPRVSDKVWARREGMVAFAGYPIQLGGELLGVIAMFSRQPLSQDVLDYLESAASEIALGMKRHQTETALLASEASLRQRTHELEQLMHDLKQAQLQMVQSEKMSALGNLVAGVAHEINNPVGFLKGNLKPASEYIQDLFGLLDLYQAALPNPPEDIEAELEAVDLEFLKEDLPKLLSSMNIGVDRIKNISTSLRTFSRADQDHKTSFNLHEGLDSTLLILKHRLKANETRPEIEVIRQYGKVPSIDCFAGQVNQVFMNLLANAIDALEEDNQRRSLAEIKAQPNQISIETSLSADSSSVHVIIKDNGAGMPDAVKAQIFNHLFTTKAVGKGTGLGLAIAHQIIAEGHNGSITVDSTPGEGTCFTVTLPILAR